MTMKSIAVYKTNIRSRIQARILVQLIEAQFPDCRANVDMHDCDRILRICMGNGELDNSALQHVLAKHQVSISELPD